MAPVRRRLNFNEPGENIENYDTEESSRKFLEKELEMVYSQDKLFWNFDFAAGVPLTGSSGRFEWMPITEDEYVPEAYNAMHPGKNSTTSLTKAIHGLNIVDGNKVQRVTAVVTTNNGKKLAQRLITSMLAIKKSVSTKTKNAGRESLAKLRKAIRVKGQNESLNHQPITTALVNPELLIIAGSSTTASTPNTLN